jgi:LPXTG-motif cell wall-anchored protein
MWDRISEFLGSWYTIGGMIVILLALIGLLFFLRSRKQED